MGEVGGIRYLIRSSSLAGPDLDQLLVAEQQVVLAVPKGNPLTKLKGLRLAGSDGNALVWFPRRPNHELYNRMMHECYRGGLKSPVQEGLNEATILSLVSTGLGVGWVLGTARWRCPETVAVLHVVDLNMPLTLALVWRRDNTSPLLAHFIGDVRRLPDVRAVNR